MTLTLNAPNSPAQVPTAKINTLPSSPTSMLAESQDPKVWTSIYDNDINIVVWQRTHSKVIANSVKALLEIKTFSQIQLALPTQSVLAQLAQDLPDFEHRTTLLEEIALLAEMFACLFNQDTVGLRLKALNTAMCPKFHVDRVPCRLVTTYAGPATEWVPHEFVDRDKLGAGSNGLREAQSGLLQHSSNIKRINTGDVALIKGELWENNEGRGLVHRSPSINNRQKRLLFTLDFA